MLETVEHTKSTVNPSNTKRVVIMRNTRCTSWRMATRPGYGTRPILQLKTMSLVYTFLCVAPPGSLSFDIPVHCSAKSLQVASELDFLLQTAIQLLWGGVIVKGLIDDYQQANVARRPMDPCAYEPTSFMETFHGVLGSSDEYVQELCHFPLHGKRFSSVSRYILGKPGGAGKTRKH